ncbi:hypothetical protein HanPSC8_Chr14g0635101 [Helianthus annuus]|nr:hypothetical protein HanPSC8_Chr14g0635101 [Helianthus annuus]
MWKWTQERKVNGSSGGKEASMNTNARGIGIMWKWTQERKVNGSSGGEEASMNTNARGK